MKRFRVCFILVALMCSVGFAESADGYVEVENVESRETEADVGGAGDELCKKTSAFASKTFGGGFWSCGSERSGGYGEFGWALVDESKNDFVLRDSFVFGGYGTQLGKVSFGELQIGNKLSIGGVYNCDSFKIRSYGFAGAAVGFIGSSNVQMFKGAPMLEINVGGGFEFQFHANNAFVIEYGGRCEGPVGKKKADYKAYTNSSPILTIGYRTLK